MKTQIRSLPLNRLLLLLCLVSWQSISFGQSWISPVFAETHLGLLGTNPVLNCANITYNPTAPNGSGQLIAICWDAGGTSYASGPGFVVQDGWGGTPIVVTPTRLASARSLDIVVGNGGIVGGSNVYKIGLCYEMSSIIYLDVYTVLNPGTPSFSVEYNSTTQISEWAPPGGPGNCYFPRIDLIEETAITSTNTYGLPNCSKWEAVWEDRSGTYTGMNSVWGDLNSSVLSVVTSFSIGGVNMRRPDIAAIQINSGGTPQDYARTTFSDDDGNVYEWEAALTSSGWSPTMSGTIVMPAAPPTSTDSWAYSYPRIDAIDDYLTSQNPGQANYLIAANYTHTGTGYISGTPPIPITYKQYYIHTYNNIGGLITNSSPFLDAQVNNSACVAAGPGNVYSVGYYTDHIDPRYGYPQHFLEQTFDLNTGLLSNNNYYEVDNLGHLGFATSDIMPVTISKSCNDGAYTLNAWCYNNKDLYFKLTPNPIAFKQPSSMNSAMDITVAPNPASDQITISGIDKNDAYTIMSIDGKVVMKGNANSTSQLLNISNLAKGTYLVDIYGKDAKKTIKFIKQ